MNAPRLGTASPLKLDPVFSHGRLHCRHTEKLEAIRAPRDGAWVPLFLT